MAPETTSLWRLPALIEARHNLGSGTHPLTYRYHEILATPARLLVFALLASVFSLYPWRRKSPSASGFCLSQEAYFYCTDFLI